MYNSTKPSFFITISSPTRKQLRYNVLGNLPVATFKQSTAFIVARDEHFRFPLQPQLRATEENKGMLKKVKKYSILN